MRAEQNGIPVSDALFALIADRAERLGIVMPLRAW